MTRSVEVTAPAKVNLFLGVGALREDGYHDVVTVMHALEIADSVTMARSDRLAVSTVPDLGFAEEDNLAWRAATTLADAMGVSCEVDVRIEKRVPHGAGLGGGSSDAAAVIAGLCRLNDIDVSHPDVLAAAAAVGADVPFFLTGPAALMAGRGDELVRCLPPVQVPVTLIKPAEPVSTADAYREFDRRPLPAGDPAALVASLERGEFNASLIANNLAVSAIGLVPESGEALALASSSEGVLAATISGSGSAVFAVCADGPSAASLARNARGRGWWAETTWTAREGVTVTRTEDGR